MTSIKIVRSKPALILEGKKRYLVVTDLHIGFEAKLVANDIYVNPRQVTEETIKDLEIIIKDEKPDVLVLLGDVKSGTESISKIEWTAVPLYFEIGKKIDTILVPGNHDGNIQKLAPDWITVSSPTGVVIEDALLTHGHVMPSENFSSVDKIIMGHVHPIFFQQGSVLDGERVWVSIKTEKKTIFPSSRGQIEITIIPSFNRYFYASYKKSRKRSISPILEAAKESELAKIATLDGSIIGNESMLQKVF